MHIVETDRMKRLSSPDYNYVFRKDSGLFLRWGKTKDDDPQFSPFGPEILDIEISIDGCPNNCPFCYKGNTNKPATNMSFDAFKKIIDKMPPTLTQTALGITGVQTNPDFIRMMEYCREKGIIPNFTLSGIDLTDEIAVKVSKLVGALAVSAYQSNKNVCYDTVKKFTDLGIEQTNIHLMVSQETLPFVEEVLTDRVSDPRLKGMSAIVFLGVKNKGRAMSYHSLSTEDYTKLVTRCLKMGIPFGFDSCSAPKFERAVHAMDLPDNIKSQLLMSSESCESGLFSSYINVFGFFFPCSFSEGEKGWEAGLDVANADDFLRDVWNHERTAEWRKNLIDNSCGGCRQCPAFPHING